MLTSRPYEVPALRFYPGQRVTVILADGKPIADTVTAIQFSPGMTSPAVICQRAGAFNALTGKVGNWRLVWPDHIQDLPLKGAYVEAWKRLKALPDTVVVNTPWCWYGKTVKAAKRDFLHTLHKRISARGAPPPGWRKWDDDQQVKWLRDRAQIYDWLTRRVRFYQFETAECRQRFAFVLSSYED